MTDHTPGPWTISSKDTAANGAAVMSHVDSNRVGIARVTDDWTHTTDRTPAEDRPTPNANLIAAAPDMFDALGNLIGYMEALGTGQLATIEEDSEVHARHAKALFVAVGKQALDALEKAEGRTSD